MSRRDFRQILGTVLNSIRIRKQHRRPVAITVPALLMLCFSLSGAARAQNTSPPQETWRLDRTDSINDHNTKTLGHPQVVAAPYGKALQFNGVDDALFVDVHPLAGASTWTWEVIFKPDADGAPAQRFFHLSVLDAQGKDTDDRMLFEIRIVDGAWCLDSFALTGEHKLTLLNCQKRYPFGHWYRVTAVYDGKTLSNYVGDELQGQGEVALTPQGEGHASIGTRINQKDFFKGAIFESRFTREALPVRDFLKMPAPR
jgi:Concanavalin A-like lectin/glucanases superfamily